MPLRQRYTFSGLNKIAGCAGGAILSLLIACNDLNAPETGSTPSEAAQAAPYPDLLEQDAMSAALVPDGPVYAEVQTTLEELDTRSDGLQRRAEDLSGPVMTEAERQILLESTQAQP